MPTKEITYTQSDLDDFAAKLEAIVASFTEEEQLLLAGLMAKGVEAVREENADVEGFLLPAVRNQLPAVQLSACDGSVRPGAVLKASGDPHAAKAIIAVLNFGGLSSH